MAIILGLGGNLQYNGADPQKTIMSSIAALNKCGLSVDAVSPFYSSRPVPDTGQPDFINAAVLINKAPDAATLLDLCHEIEAQFGRQRLDRWEARTLDIDLLLYDDVVLPTKAAWWSVVNDTDPAAFLTLPMVPHPRLHLRAFALLPLLDLLPEFIHPVTGQTGAELVQDCRDQPIAKISES